MFFDEIKEAPRDAVFGLIGAYNQDQRIQKVNLLVGIYKNRQLQNELMASVKEARRQDKPDAFYADYLPMDGYPELIEMLGPMIFGDSFWKDGRERIYGAQTIGGTGALRVGAELLAQEVGKVIFVPEPTWPNHPAIFNRAQFQVETYPYYNHQLHGFDFDALVLFLQKAPKRSIILLHAACHNPTGCDPSLKEWRQIARIMKERQLLPFFDFAYQGLGDGLQGDAAAVRLFAEEGLEFLVAYSCSKNFSMYCQRVGALFVVSSDAKFKAKIASQTKRIIRTLYSNPPAPGALIVAHILGSELRSQWQKELGQMHERLVSTRKEFAERLIAKDPSGNYQALLQHKGMFSFIDLNREQVQKLIDQYAIYMLDNGRINVAGLNAKNIDYVVDGILAVNRTV